MYIPKERILTFYDRLAEKTAKALCADESSQRFANIRYGSQAWYVTILKSLGLLLIAACINGRFVIVMLFFFLCVGMLRKFSYGAHMPNTVLCSLIGGVQYLGGGWMAVTFGWPWWVRGLILAVAGIVFYRYAPAETKKRPIPQNQRAGLKKRSLLCLGVVGSFSFLCPLFFPTWTGMIPCIAAISQSIHLLPVWQQKQKMDR